jgi:hypothetical protein
MKKTLIALTLLVVMASCGNNENKGADTTAAGGDAGFRHRRRCTNS